MRYLIAIVLLLGVFTASAQKNKFKGAGFDYTKTAPNYIPVRGTESEIAIDSLTGKWMQYSYQSAEWWHLGYFVTETGTSGSPSYTPNKVKSVMAINAGDSLYHYRAGTWYLIAGGGGGAGITDGDKGDVDVTGGGTVWTIDTGAVTMIKINQDGAAVGQVIKWNGTTWAPANDNTLSAGAGGLYGPSDLVTYNHVATVDSGLTFSSAEDTAYFNIIMAPGAFGSAAYFNSDSIRLRRYDVGGSNEVVLNSDGILLKTTTPDRVTIQGADARYAADYRATYSARSFIDKQYGDDFYLQEVDSLLVSNDTLYISLARDSVPEKFVVLPASDDTSGYNLDFRISNDTLYIEDADGALFVDLDPYKDNTDTSGYNLGARISGDTLYIRDGDGEIFVALPADADAQTLSVDSTDIGGIIERFEVSISNGNSVYIDVPQVSGSGAGQNNVGANLGSGTGVYAGKTDTILQFKSLVEGYGIDLSNTSTEITIKADTAQLATLHDVAVVQGDIDAHEIADGDLSPTNEIQNIFQTISVSGQSDVVADGATDALTLVNGAGITITTNAGTDAITVTNSAPDQTVVINDGTGTDVTGTYPTFTVNSTITQYTDELAQDAVGLILLDGTTIDFTYDDGTPNITAEVKTNSISNTYLTSGTGGIYKGSGIIANAAVATVDTSSTFQIKYSNNSIGFNFVDGTGVELISDDGTEGIAAFNGTGVEVNASAFTVVNSDGVSSGVFRILEPAGVDYLIFLAQNMSTSRTFTWPANYGSSGQQLTTNGSGTLSWADAGAGVTDLTFTGASTPYTLNSSTGADVTFAQGTGITLSRSTNELTVTNSAPDQTVSLTNGGGVVVTGTYPSFTLTATDQSITNEIQRFDTFEIVSNVLRASLLNDGLPFSSVSLSAYLDNTDNQTLDTFEIVSNILRASNFGDGVPFKSVDLSPYLDNTDTQDLSIDSAATTGGQNFTIGLTDGGEVSLFVPTDTDTDEQTLIIDSTDLVGIERYELEITGGNTIYLDDDDNQTIDTLSLAGSILSVSVEEDGLPAKTVDLSSLVVAADVITLADSAALKAYTGSATGVLLKQAGRQGTFVRAPTTRVHDGFIVFTDGNGNKWQRIIDNVINVKWFGAKGDGVTDDTWAIQRAIDYSIYEDTLIKQVFIPTGNYVITKTIHLGYGNAYHSVSLIGDGAPTFRGEIASFNGTMLSPTFSNSPAINIQGARYTTVENITLVGVNDITGFLSDTSASNINNWLDSGLDAIADNQRTPYAGITIDAFSGTAPSPGYAHYAYPSYAGDTTQYNKDFSSQVKISNVGIHGFVAGIVLQPNSDGNGDFTQVEKCIIDRVAYGISVGNANSRNFKILDCYIDAHTGITNSTHGNQTGRVTLIQNNHFGGYQWFALNNLPYLEGLEINNNYGESFYWLGSIGSVAGNQPTITFNGCDFSMLATSQGTLQRFGDFIGSGAFVFNDCSFKNNRLYQFNNPNQAWIDFNQCKFNADVFEGEPGDTVETYHDIFFRNMLFVVGTYPERIKVNKSRFTEYTETNSLAFPQQDGNGVTFPALLTYTSYWLDRSNEGVDVQYKDLGYPGGYLGITSAFDTYAFSGRTFTGKVKSNYKHGIGIGDALLIRDGDVFLPCMITEIDAGDTITALLMTGYKYNTTTGAFETAFNSTALSSANVQHISSRKFLNTRTITGTFTAGSTTVTDVKYVYDGTDAATNFEESTPLLNMDGLLNAQTSPVSNDTWIDSVLSASSILLSEAAIRNGTFPIQNCFTGNGGDKTAIPVQQIVYGNGNDIKSEAAFLYDSTNNRVILNGTSGERQITLNPKSGETTSTGGIRINSDGVADTDPVGRLEFVGNTTTGPYTQKGYIAFDVSGASAKGQALVFGLTTDGQSVLGTTTLYENQLLTNNSGGFTIANNTGRLRIQASSAGIYNTDNNWLLGGSAYTTNDSAIRLKLAGDNSDTSTTEYGLRIYNGFNQPYFSARNDGNVILGGRTVASEFQILEASGSGTNYTGFKAQPMSANLMYTLPAAAGTAGQQLTWNSSNILTWEDAGGTPTNIYTADGNIKDGGTIVDVSGNDPIILALDNATTEQNRMLRLTFDHTDDVTNTYGISFVGPNDSLEIRSYDSGMYLDYEGVTSSGEGFVISSNTVLDLRGDSILVSTLPTRTTLPFIVGLQGNTLSKIEGTTDGEVITWNETDGGFWEVGTASGSDGNIYDNNGNITVPLRQMTIDSGVLKIDQTRTIFTGDTNFKFGSSLNFGDLDVGYTIISSTLERISDGTDISGTLRIDPSGVILFAQSSLGGSTGSTYVQLDTLGLYFSNGLKTIWYEETSGGNYTSFRSGSMTTNLEYIWPTDAPNDGEALVWNTGSQLSWEAAGGADGNGIYDGDGTLQSGATEALLPAGAQLAVQYDGGNVGLSVSDATDEAYISGQSGTYTVYADNSNSGFTHGSGGWLTGSTYALTGSASVASTNTVTDRLIIQGNVASTVPSAGFGSGILFQGESSTTDNQDMARITSAWTTITHASREAKIGVELGNNGGALAEIANFNVSGNNAGQLSIGSSNAVLISNSGITTATTFTVGGSSSSLTLGGSSGGTTLGGSTGAVNIFNTNTANIALYNNANATTSTAGILVGNATAFTQTGGTRNYMNFTSGFAPTSGTATHNRLAFTGTVNQTGGASGQVTAVLDSSVLTAVANYVSFKTVVNTANAKGFVQTGASSTNNFVGGIAAGTTSAPNASAQIDIVSTTKGLGMPAMTDAQMNAIGSPREGLTVYSTDQDALMLRDNAIWKRLPTTRTVLKTADETVNNSDTYQADDHLVFTAKANKKYVVKYFLYVEDVNFNPANGAMKLKVTAPSATTVRYGATGGAGLAAAYGDGATDITITDLFGSSPGEGHIVITAYINPGASDRTVTLEWAQFTADASDTKILEGSFLEYEEIN